MLKSRKYPWLKMAGLVLLGVAFATTIIGFIRKYIPALADILEKSNKK